MELITAVKNGKFNIVKKIISAGEDVNSRDPDASTALHYAMSTNHPRVFKLLLDCSDTNFNVENKDGNTPLQLAVSCNNAANVKMFLQDKRCTSKIINNKNKSGETALSEAINCGNLEIVQEFQTTEGVDWKGVKATTITAAKRKNYHGIVEIITNMKPKTEKTEKRKPEDEDGQQEMKPVAQTPKKPKLDDEKKKAQKPKSLAKMEAEAKAQIKKNLENDLSMLKKLDEDEKKEFKAKQLSRKKEIEETKKRLKHMEDEYEKEKLKNDTVVETRKKEIENKKKELADHKTKATKGKNESVASGSKANEKLIPECPVCMDEMRPPTRIYSCGNGHLICEECKPGLGTCATCRTGLYTTRATAMEQLVRQALNAD